MSSSEYKKMENVSGYYINSLKGSLMGWFFYLYQLILWSQIKLTSYDFSDLHINGEFDNRPGTGLFLRIFSCVVTYRTSAGRRLYKIASADARSGTVRPLKHRPVPGRASLSARTVIARFVKRISKVHGSCQTSYGARFPVLYDSFFSV